MAAGTPTNLSPGASEAGIPLEGKLEYQWSLYSGAGTLAYIRLLKYSDAGGTVLVWDSLWMAPGEPGWANGRLIVDAARQAPTSGATHYWKVGVKNSVPETSSYSALTQFTYATAKLTGANHLLAQP